MSAPGRGGALLRSAALAMAAWCVPVALVIVPGNGAVRGAQEAFRPAVDADLLMRDLEVLASDDMQGREPGTAGHARARDFILRRFKESGLEAPAGGYLQPFAFTTRREPDRPREGANIVGLARGRVRPELALVVTAHYDHVGVREGEVFNGANDNATGVAALFALAGDLARRRPDHTVVVAALDAEELGLRGARAFLEAPPVPRASLLLNVNLDMIGRDAENTLYAAGTSHYPWLRPHLERVAAAASARLRFGHDGPGSPAVEDWTRESDHFAFHERGIPFVYFGVEDHDQHHKATDDAATITRAFYAGAVTTILAALRELDRAAPTLAKAGRGEPLE